ncbi:MAG: cell division protein SepF [Acetivibrio ethanolgignens]
MPNIVRNFINSLKLNEDDYEDYIDDFEEEEELEPKKVKPTALPSRQKEALAPKFADRERPVKREEVPEAKKERPSSRMERTTNNKIVPIRTTSRGFEVCIMRPSSFEDSQDICDMLLTGRAAVYAINGKLHQISKYIFIFSPDTVDISGDYLDLADIGFGVPNLNKEF